MYIGNDCALENGLKISVDWIGFTVKKFTSFLSVMDYFGLSIDDFSHSTRGMYGYKSCLRHPSYKLLVLYDGNDNMGIHVEVPSSALPYFLDCYFSKHSDITPFGVMAFNVTSFDDTLLSYLLKDILDIGQLTRMDLAIDDIGCNYYSLDELLDILKNGLFISRFRKFRVLTESEKKGSLGSTIYFGSRKSALMLRVYDKQLEQNSKKRKESI